MFFGGDKRKSSSLHSLGGFALLSFFLRNVVLSNILSASRRVGGRGREPSPASGRGWAGVAHLGGSLKAFCLHPAPPLARLSPRPRGALFGGCGEGADLSSGAPDGTDEVDPRGARHWRLAGRRILRDAGGVPGWRLLAVGRPFRRRRVSRTWRRPHRGLPHAGRWRRP